MLECRNMPHSSSRPPVDLILHAAAEALHSLTLAAVKDNHPDDAAKFAACRHGLTRAIRPEALAEEWNADGDHARHGERVAGICAAQHSTRVPSVGHTRAIEVAVARRLADTACALTITGESEDAAQAGALWRAAGALTGMTITPSGFKVPTAQEVAAAHGPLIKTMRQALAAEPHVDIVAYARATKAQADRARVYRDERHKAWTVLNAIQAALGAQEGSDLPAQARLIRARAVDNEGMLAARTAWQDERAAIVKALGTLPDADLASWARSVYEEREALRADAAAISKALGITATNDLAGAASMVITHAEGVINQSDAVREALGARDGEDNLAAAKRVMQEYEDTRGERDAAFVRRNEMRAERDALKGRDPCDNEPRRQGEAWAKTATFVP
jgi:hypothetical protein